MGASDAPFWFRTSSHTCTHKTVNGTHKTVKGIHKTVNGTHKTVRATHDSQEVEERDVGRKGCAVLVPHLLPYLHAKDSQRHS